MHLAPDMRFFLSSNDIYIKKQWLEKVLDGSGVSILLVLGVKIVKSSFGTPSLHKIDPCLLHLRRW